VTGLAGRLLTRGVSRPALVSALIVAPFLLSNFNVRILTEILIFGMFALSLNLLLGFTGMPSIGHAAYFGAGGYSAALLATNVTDSLLLGLVAGFFGALIFAVMTGAFVIRSTGVYFIMLTLALAELFRSGVERSRNITGGDEGVSGIPVGRLFGDFTLSASAAPRLFYFYAFLVFIIVYLLLERIRDSPFGRSLVGIRENPARMRAVGYPVDRYRFAAFVLGCSIAGLAGALYVQFARFISPDLVGFAMSALIIMMVILGGTYTLYGPVMGAAVVILVREEVSSRFDHWEIALGLAFMSIIYVMPRGLGGLMRDAANRLRTGPSDSSATTRKARRGITVN
jgi:branched-chain amino acid transport system permease protein